MPASNPIIDSKLILHRGASAHAPENTLEALHLAGDMGAAWVETDVRVTHDDQLVMVHDFDVERTTNGSGRVSLMNLADIRGLDAGQWFSEKYRGATIPTLEEYLIATQQRNLGLVLELKDETGWEEKLARLVAATVQKVWTSAPRRLVISGASERCLRQAKMDLPNFPQCHGISAVPDDPVQRLADSGADMLHLQNGFANDETLQQLTATGMEFAFATVNDRGRAEYLLDRGATSILTDMPGLLDHGSLTDPTG